MRPQVHQTTTMTVWTAGYYETPLRPCRPPRFSASEVVFINSVKTIINEWDPVDLLYHAPDDEYRFEIEDIERLLESIQNHSELALEIQNIFLKSFGDDFLKNTPFECADVARKILQIRGHRDMDDTDDLTEWSSF